MAVLIDTSVLVEAERRGDLLDRAIGDAHRAIGDAHRAISVITASELLHGVHRARTPDVRARRAAFVEHLLAVLDPLPVTMGIARAHAEVWAELERIGQPIGAHDLWIAATALGHGMDVATANAREFERVPGLDVVPV